MEDRRSGDPHSHHAHEAVGHDPDHRPHGHHHRDGLLGALRRLLSPHSHDAKDSLDQALEGSRDGIRAVAISLAVLLVTAGIQALVVVASGSVALLGDTLHNGADALTAVPLWLAFRLGRRAPTSRFTYGYGKAEDVAGVVVLALIFGSAAFAGYEAIERLIHPQKITQLGIVMAAAVAGAVGNEVVAQYRIRVGRRIGSAALEADGIHARTDGVTSLLVLIGAVAVALGARVGGRRGWPCHLRCHLGRRLSSGSERRPASPRRRRSCDRRPDRRNRGGSRRRRCCDRGPCTVDGTPSLDPSPPQCGWVVVRDGSARHCRGRPPRASPPDIKPV